MAENSRFSVMAALGRFAGLNGPAKPRRPLFRRAGLALALAMTVWSDVAAAMVVANATGPKYREPWVQDGWSGVVQLQTASGGCSGAFITSEYVLTAAHCFFPGNNGIGTPTLTARMLRGVPYTATDSLSVVLEPGYDKTVGHRAGGHDLAVVKFPVQRDIEKYAINANLVADERDSELVAWILGYGWSGNGEDGAAHAPDGLLRLANNIVDQFGDGRTSWTGIPDAITPPANTLVYDFDDPTKNFNTTSLINALSDDPLKSYAVGPREGIPAPGDSGGPMFQFLDDKPVLVGVTSSGMRSSDSKFGTIVFGTRVSCYSGWLRTFTEAVKLDGSATDGTNACPIPEPPSWSLLLLCASAALLVMRLRQCKEAGPLSSTQPRPAQAGS